MFHDTAFPAIHMYFSPDWDGYRPLLQGTKNETL